MLVGLYDAVKAFAPMFYILLVVIGYSLVGIGVFKAATHARSTQPQTQIRAALTALLIGSLLIAIEKVLNISSSTLSMDPNAAVILRGEGFATIEDSSGLSEYTQGINFALALIQVVGLLGFARGWLMLYGISKGGGQGMSVGHSLTLIVGGTLAVNIKPFLEMIGRTMGGSAETIIGFLIEGGSAAVGMFPPI